MKKKNAFIRALETSEGKSNFSMMLLFIGLTFIISYFFADRGWYETAVWIISFMSIAFGSAFCKVMFAVKQEDDQNTPR